jgi:hypothetical protein
MLYGGRDVGAPHQIWRMAFSPSSSAPHPTGADLRWLLAVASDVGLGGRGGIDIGRNPWLVVPAKAVVMPVGADTSPTYL